MSYPLRAGFLARVSAVAILVAAAPSLLALFHLRELGELQRRSASALRDLAAAAGELEDARSHVFTIESELRETRPAAATIRRNREALGAAMHRYRGRVTEWSGRAPVEAPRWSTAVAHEQEAMRSAFASLAALDSASAGGTAANERAVNRAHTLMTSLAQLAEANRSTQELVREATREAAARERSQAFWSLSALSILSILLCALMAWRLARRLGTIAAVAGRMADGVLVDEITRGSATEMGELEHQLERVRRLLRARDMETRTLREEIALHAGRVEEVERASEAKTWFIGHVSHEFRTPLSSIIGFASLLTTQHDRLASARRAEYLEIVLRNARHLLHVINDILNLSKVEAGTLEVTLAPVHITEVVAGVVASLQPQAEEREIRIVFAEAGRPLVTADTGRLRQVVLNLVENAVKYSPRGTSVEVRISSRGGEVRLEVRDQGPGIAPEDQKRLFKEFSRIRQEGVQIAGAGLGLALSKRLVTLMGGRIGVESTSGKGSTFWVSLPSADEYTGATAVAPSAAPAGVPGRMESVAVVDDDRDIRAYAAAILEHAGYNVFTDEGVAGLGERLAPHRPKIVLLDLHLSDRSGFDALEELRSIAAFASTPVVAFTAGATADEAARVLESGFLGCLIKPIEPEALVDGVRSALRAAAEAEGTEDPDDFLAPLRARFRNGLRDRLATMEYMLSLGDLQGLAREVHKLRGAAAGYGMEELSSYAGLAEEELRADEPGAGPHVAELLRRLQDAAPPRTA